MFDFSDLNMQVMPDDLQQQQFHWCPHVFTYPCKCLTKPLTICRCLSNAITCPCFSRVQSFCKCLTTQITLPCICLSKPIASVPPRDFFGILEQVKGLIREVTDVAELEVLKAELQEAIKHVDVQREVMIRASAPQSDAAFDDAERQLKQQLDDLQKQREEFRKTSGGPTGGGAKK